MELLEINTHFFLCFIINGVAATLWQLQLTIGKRGKAPQDWRIHTAYILNSSVSSLFFHGLCLKASAPVPFVLVLLRIMTQTL